MSIPFPEKQPAGVPYSQKNVSPDQIKRIMIKAQENERNELGRELHDNINQILAAVRLQLEYSLENYENEKATAYSGLYCTTRPEQSVPLNRN